MSILSAKPGGSNRGKNKIYFCCHKDDFSIFFDSISDEILKNAENSAIYYCEDGDNDDFSEEHREDLKAMQLFVVPVTTRLLCYKNTAMDKEIPFAIKEGIPVLPLLQENITESYTKRFGELQFLYKYDNDKTAIPYEEKLKKYLASLLVDDKTADRVRTAFDAYIFLSYRKKDRAYANTLMKLIHSNEKLRDIAIWYDEFLIPGERFPEMIENALKKSDLFAMLVTPNLTDEENYVISTEYPMAKRENKTILPAEAVPTDRKKLKNCCRLSLEASSLYSKDTDELNNTVNISDTPYLFSSFIHSIKKLDNKTNNSDPEHNYLIGLAYLTGIDVETNRERGAELIKASAESGNTEAIKKLVSMYNSGEGVERNYDTAIKWQKKLVVISEDRLKKTGRFSDAQELISVLMNLGVYLRNSGKTADALNTYYHCADICNKTYTDTDKNELLYYKIKVNCRLSDILTAEKQFYEAKNFLEITLRLLENYDDGLDKGEFMSMCYVQLGNISKARGKLTEALDYYTKSRTVQEYIAGISDTVDNKSDLSTIYRQIGDIYKELSDYKEAFNNYMDSLGICKELNKISDTVYTKRLLCICYTDLGRLYEAKKDTDKALMYYTEVFGLAKQIFEQDDTIDSKNGMSVSYERLGDISLIKRDYEKALEYFMKCHELCESVLEISDTVEAKRNMSIVLIREGDAYKGLGNTDKAMEYYVKSRVITEALTENSDSIELKRDLSICYIKTGDLNFVNAEVQGTKDCYNKAYNICEEILETSDTIEAKRDLSVIYIKLGTFTEALEEYSNALFFFSEAMKLRTKICKISYVPQAERDKAICYERLGNVYKALGKPEEAIECYKNEMSITDGIKEHCPGFDPTGFYPVILNNMGDAYKQMGDDSEAFICYAKSLNYFESEYNASRSAETGRNLTVAYYKTGAFFTERKDFPAAERYLLKAAEYGESLYRNYPIELFRKTLEGIYYILADAYTNMGSDMQAEIYLRKAAAL